MVSLAKRVCPTFSTPSGLISLCFGRDGGLGRPSGFNLEIEKKKIFFKVEGS